MFITAARTNTPTDVVQKMYKENSKLQLLEQAILANRAYQDAEDRIQNDTRSHHIKAKESQDRTPHYSEVRRTFYRVVPEVKTFSSKSFNTLEEAEEFVKQEGLWKSDMTQELKDRFYSKEDQEHYTEYWRDYATKLSIYKVEEVATKQ